VLGIQRKDQRIFSTQKRDHKPEISRSSPQHFRKNFNFWCKTRKIIEISKKVPSASTFQTF